jgi:thiopeptide-type bacteriocin biosynthesis protein
MTWTSLHCRLSWAAEHVDTFVTGTLAPMLNHRDWFYIRYWETGPHLRVRVRGALDPNPLREAIRRAEHSILDIDPDKYPRTTWLPHGDVRETPYVPEVERYGGPAALPVAEDLFCHSTRVAVAVLKSAHATSAKVTAAIELAMATTKALGLDRPAAAAWLRMMGASWRFAQETSTLESHFSAHRILSKHGTALAARWDREPQGATAHWIDRIRAARSTVDEPHVWASQLHMLFNRLGITPEQERMICWVVAATALNGPAPFHEDGPDAPDRRYLEASKFLPGFPEQYPRKATPATRRGTIPLPEPQDLTTTLSRALTARHTSRGEALTGELTTQDLATLLWTAHATTDGHWPYPSPGAQYCARLRVIALNVDGLTSGCYEADEVTRTLAWTGPAPSIADLESTSMWLGPETTPLAGTPAVLALYVRVGALRQSYGIRALRFAFTEAGHLAQNLGLVAAAMGLGLGLIGGIYDDLAHDLLAVDGVNDVLVYLLPVARSKHDIQQ